MLKPKEQNPSATATNESEAMFAAVIYPKAKQVGCVLLQALYGGSSRVPSLCFDSRHWATAPPEEKPVMARGTLVDWRKLAKRWAS